MSAAEAIALADVECTVERRKEWRDGFEAGIKVGAARYFASPLMEDLACEITVLRGAVEALAKREAWYLAKLRDAYHVIGHPRGDRL